MTPREIAVLAAASPSVTVAVAGDLMLDETWIGSVERVAPEAPVPLLALSSMSRRAGGAGNVVENLAALGARAITLGAVGPGEEGAWLARRLTSLGGASGTIVVDERRTTPVKRRMVSEGRQMLRVDEELPAGLSPAAEAALVAAARTAVAAADVLLVSDYAKGTLTPAVTAALFEAARAKGIPALVDPKGRDYGRYRGATVVTPNRRELETVTGGTARDLPAVARLGERLRDDLGLESLLVKLSEEGMLLLTRGQEPRRITARAREVFDVTGAGDTVLATLGVALGCGLDLFAAAEVANRAAGCAVARVGHGARPLGGPPRRARRLAAREGARPRARRVGLGRAAARAQARRLHERLLRPPPSGPREAPRRGARARRRPRRRASTATPP